MVTYAIEGIIIVSALISAGSMIRRNQTKSKKVLATTIVLIIAVFIGFSMAQLCSILNIVDFSITYTPLEILSILCFVYWVSFFTSNSSMFDKIIGE